MYKNIVSEKVKESEKETDVTMVFSYAVICGIAVILALAIVGWVRESAAHTATNFVTEASVGNEFEIESSRLALAKSQNEMVREFAQHMIDDHTKAGADLQAALAKAPDMNADIATRSDRKHEVMLDKLNGAVGQDFDKLYVKDQVKAHDQTVDLFKQYASGGDNPTLKEFARKTLPTLESHQHEIHQINATLFSY